MFINLKTLQERTKREYPQAMQPPCATLPPRPIGIGIYIHAHK